MRKVLGSVLAAVGAVALNTGAFALGDDPVATFNVKAAVALGSCRITTTTGGGATGVSDLDFGSYSYASTEARGGSGQVFSVTCNEGTNYKIGLGPGKNHTTGKTVRAMKNVGGQSSLLEYSLYKQQARTDLWGRDGGDTSLGTSHAKSDNGQYQIFGSIASGQNVPGGQYEDTVEVFIDLI